MNAHLNITRIAAGALVIAGLYAGNTASAQVYSYSYGNTAYGNTANYSYGNYYGNAYGTRTYPGYANYGYRGYGNYNTYLYRPPSSLTGKDPYDPDRRKSSVRRSRERFRDLREDSRNSNNFYSNEVYRQNYPRDTRYYNRDIR